jgi:hypothetical protein
MDYDEAINDIVVFLKQDKRVIQPWRNYASKHLQEALASIRMGLTMTDRDVPEDTVRPYILDPPVFPIPRPTGCICSDDMPPRKDCPVHSTPQ